MTDEEEHRMLLELVFRAELDDPEHGWPAFSEGWPDWLGRADLAEIAGVQASAVWDYEWRVVYVCELFGQWDPPDGWVRAAAFSTSGEAECACAGDAECVLCDGEGWVYIGDGWREVIVRSERPFVTDVPHAARMMFSHMEVATRAEGGCYIRVADGAPSWVRDVVMVCHDDGRILPDDDIYGLVYSALDTLRHCDTTDLDSGDTAHDWADSQVDIYSADLYRWLTPRTSRYVERSFEEGLASPGIGESQIKAGQYLQSLEVWCQLVDALESIVTEGGDE